MNDALLLALQMLDAAARLLRESPPADRTRAWLDAYDDYLPRLARTRLKALRPLNGRSLGDLKNDLSSGSKLVPAGGVGSRLPTPPHPAIPSRVAGLGRRGELAEWSKAPDSKSV